MRGIMFSSFSSQRGLILLLIAFILLVGIVSADLPIPVFTSNVTSGDIPVAVQFNNTMDETIPPIFVNWSFGDGNFDNETVLELQNVTYTYSVVGSYSVSLEITDISGTNITTINNYITANPQPPVATFDQNSTGGVELVTVQFNDTSTNSPDSWIWLFNNQTGNNTPVIFSTDKNPLWNFGIGNFSIQVTSTNAGGSNTSIQNAWVNVTEHPPVAAFTLNPSTGTAPLMLTLNDTSTYNPTSNYYGAQNVTGNNTWIRIGSTANLTVTLDFGLWNINETVSNSGGSNISASQQVNVTAPFLTGGFHANATSGHVPVTVSFTDESTNATGWHYTFGDGNSSTSQNPVFTYNIIGVYTVVQTVISPYLTNTTTKTNYITILPQIPVASFTKNTTGGLFPVAVQFNDTSTNIPTSWAWTFGDGGSSSVQNATHTYSSGGAYTVSLTATNAGGSSTPATATITVRNSTVSGFSGNLTSGLFPLTVQFNRTVPNDNATMWNWTPGDGSWSNTTVADLGNLSHTYSTGGTYTVRLIAQNPYYSNTTTLTNYILVENSTVSGFAGTPRGGLVSVTVVFNLSLPNNNATYVNWTFGDGAVANLTSPVSFNTSHTYTLGGTYTVTESAANPYFTNITTMTGYILATNPTVTGFTSMFVTVPFNITHPENLNASYVNWTFGDGTVANITSPFNTTHTYTTPGAYNVTETVSNPYYSASLMIPNYVVLIDSKTVFLASLDPPGPITGNHPYSLVMTDTSTGTPFTQCQIQWGDGTGENNCGTTLVHQYQLAGMYPINLAITDYGQRTSYNQTMAFIY